MNKNKLLKKMTLGLSLVMVLSGAVLPAVQAKAATNDNLVFPFAVGVEENQENVAISKNMKWKKSGIYSYEVLDETKKEATLRRIDTVNQKVVIPSQIDGYTITSVGSTAEFGGVVSEMEVLLYAASVREIVFPETVKRVGTCAFAGCPVLSKLTFAGKEAVTIGADAFENCEQLVDLKLENMIIEYQAFAGLHPIQNVILGDNVTFLDWGDDDYNYGKKPFGERKVNNMYLAKKSIGVNLNFEGNITNLYVQGKDTVMKGTAKACKKIKNIFVLPKAKAISFFKNKKKSYQVMSCKSNVGKITKKLAGSRYKLLWKKAYVKVTKYSFKKKKWKATKTKVPAYYAVTVGKDTGVTKYNKAYVYVGSDSSKNISCKVKAVATAIG